MTMSKLKRQSTVSWHIRLKRSCEAIEAYCSPERDDDEDDEDDEDDYIDDPSASKNEGSSPENNQSGEEIRNSKKCSNLNSCNESDDRSRGKGVNHSFSPIFGFVIGQDQKSASLTEEHSWVLNRPFAGSGHVRNKIHWDANDAVGLSKQRKIRLDW